MSETGERVKTLRERIGMLSGASPETGGGSALMYATKALQAFEALQYRQSGRSRWDIS